LNYRISLRAVLGSFQPNCFSAVSQLRRDPKGHAAPYSRQRHLETLPRFQAQEQRRLFLRQLDLHIFHVQADPSPNADIEAEDHRLIYI